jgi:hypothetical protein
MATACGGEEDGVGEEDGPTTSMTVGESLLEFIAELTFVSP